MTTADELIEGARALLLDFDGPVTALMPPPMNAQAADQARAQLSDVELPAEIQVTTDHLAVLRWTVDHAISRLAEVERTCTQAEVECARTSAPSPEVRGLLQGARDRSVPVAIVSNNSENAIRTFLDRFTWARSAGLIVGRTVETARLLKPHPFLVQAAVRLTGVEPARCVFVGDAVSDVQAGRAAGVLVVGLAKTADRGSELKAAGARALITRQARP